MKNKEKPISLKQIERETNEDIRSIRIDRFGWLRYIQESGAKELDHGGNDVEGTYEALYETPLGNKFVAVSPDTDVRIVALSVPKTVKTRDEARKFLSPFADRRINILGRT